MKDFKFVLNTLVVLAMVIAGSAFSGCNSPIDGASIEFNNSYEDGRTWVYGDTISNTTITTTYGDSISIVTIVTDEGDTTTIINGDVYNGDVTSIYNSGYIVNGGWNYWQQGDIINDNSQNYTYDGQFWIGDDNSVNVWNHITNSFMEVNHYVDNSGQITVTDGAVYAGGDLFQIGQVTYDYSTNSYFINHGTYLEGVNITTNVTTNYVYNTTTNSWVTTHWNIVYPGCETACDLDTLVQYVYVDTGSVQVQIVEVPVLIVCPSDMTPVEVAHYEADWFGMFFSEGTYEMSGLEFTGNTGVGINSFVRIAQGSPYFGYLRSETAPSDGIYTATLHCDIRDFTETLEVSEYTQSGIPWNASLINGAMPGELMGETLMMNPITNNSDEYGWRSFFNYFHYGDAGSGDWDGSKSLLYVANPQSLQDYMGIFVVTDGFAFVADDQLLLDAAASHYANEPVYVTASELFP